MKFTNVFRWFDAAALLALCLSLCLPAAHGQPASQGPEQLDTSWATFDGLSWPATSGFGTLYTDVFGADDFGNAMMVLPDFSVILAGHCTYLPLGKDVFCAARYDALGNLVTSWGTNSGKMVASLSSSNDQAYAAVLQADGKFVLGGRCWDPSSATNVFCLARFTANGDGFDSSFNGNGKVFTSISGSGGGDRITSMALQPDGKIVAAGSCGPVTDVVFCIARYNPDGSLDLAFNPNGASNGLGYFTTSIGTFPLFTTKLAPSLAIDAKNRIVLAGYCADVSATTISVCAVRYNSNGTLDTGFNGTGKRVLTVSGLNGSGHALALQPDGRIVIGGQLGGDFLLVRLSEFGALDPRFAPLSPLGAGILRVSITGSSERILSLAIQPDGKVLAAGSCDPSSGLRSDFCFARFHSDGNLDESFATGSANGSGKLVLPMGTGTTSIADGVDHINAIRVLRDGRIMLGGSCFIGGNAQFCTARLLGSTFQRAWRNCTADIDGDGKFVATIDGLINLRVAFGLTGTAVTNGITFPSGALRNDWASIRRYLMNDCGLSIP